MLNKIIDSTGLVYMIEKENKSVCENTPICDYTDTQRNPQKGKKLSAELMQFIKFYERAFPEFIRMYGELIGFYCFESDTFHIEELNSEYKTFQKK